MKTTLTTTTLTLSTTAILVADFINGSLNETLRGRNKNDRIDNVPHTSHLHDRNSCHLVYRRFAHHTCLSTFIHCIRLKSHCLHHASVSASITVSPCVHVPCIYVHTFLLSVVLILLHLSVQLSVILCSFSQHCFSVGTNCIL